MHGEQKRTSIYSEGNPNANERMSDGSRKRSPELNATYTIVQDTIS